MFQKFAVVESIIEVKQTPNRLVFDSTPGTSLSKFAKLEDQKESDGYLYVRCRAISSRVNKNNDGWPSEELANAYSTFVGRPVFVDHNNDNPKRTRGVIVDSKLHVDDDEKTSRLDPYYSTAPDNHKPPTWIELLIEVDANTYPKLAKAIRNEDIDAVSMGANIEKSTCSVCAHEASTPSEYCDHIKKKGITFEITADNGEKLRKKAYEDCYGVNFFEISFVFDPADTTALISEKEGKTASVVDSFIVKNAIAISVCPRCGGELVDESGEGRRVECTNCNWKGTYDQAASKQADNGFKVPIGLLDDAYVAIKGKGDNGDHCPQCGTQNVPVPTPVPGQPPLYRCVACNQEYTDYSHGGEHMTTPTGKTAANPVDFFVEPIGTSHDSDDPNYIPQSDQVTAPQQVNTLRPEHRCPVCRAADMVSDPDGIKRCPTCGHVQEPDPLNNPDLSQARDTDLRMDTTDTTDPEGNREIPVNDGTEGIEIAPMNPVSPVAARNQRTTKGVISDMFTTKLRTNSRKEVDGILAAKPGRIETTLGGSLGIHVGTAKALKEAGLDVKLTFPKLKDHNYVELPKHNPTFALIMAEESADKLGHGKNLTEVPVIVEASSQGDAVKATKIIVAYAAAKKPILTDPKPGSDEPAKQKVVADEFKPREAKTAGDTVTIGDKTYKLVAIDPDEEDEESLEDKNADRRHIVRSEQSADGVIRSEEIVEETDAKEEEQQVEQQPVSAVEKEARLLQAMKIADEAVELGIVDKESKMVFIASLESEEVDTLNAREEMLNLTKSAGLTRNKSRLAGVSLRRVPRLAHSAVDETVNGHGSPDNIPDEAIYLS